MTKRYLTPIRVPYITIEDDPILPTDGANKKYVDDMFNIRGIPSGGTTGQVLGKVSNNDYDVGWVNNNGGPPFGNSGMHFNGGDFTTAINAYLHGGYF